MNVWAIYFQLSLSIACSNSNRFFFIGHHTEIYLCPKTEDFHFFMYRHTTWEVILFNELQIVSNDKFKIYNFSYLQNVHRTRKTLK